MSIINSKTLQKAELRAAEMSAIEPPLDLHEGLNLVAYRTKIADTRTLLANYNGLAAAAAEMRLRFATAEKELADHSDRILAGVGYRYVKNSNVYLQAGGTRKVDRKWQRKKAASGNETLTNAA